MTCDEYGSPAADDGVVPPVTNADNAASADEQLYYGQYLLLTFWYAERPLNLLLRVRGMSVLTSGYAE